MSALPSAKVDEEEADFETSFEVIETKSHEYKIHPLSNEVIPVEGRITVSF